MRNWLLYFKHLVLRVFVICVGLWLTMHLPNTSIASEPLIKEHALFRTSTKECSRCHSNEEVQPLAGRTTRSCSTYCLTCHTGHHKLDVRLGKEPKTTLPLTDNKKITCYTCHDLTKNRFDTAPWRSESLFDRYFNKQESYMTFYLRINNHNGDLCKNCH